MENEWIEMQHLYDDLDEAISDGHNDGHNQTRDREHTTKCAYIKRLVIYKIGGSQVSLISDWHFM